MSKVPAPKPTLREVSATLAAEETALRVVNKSAVALTTRSSHFSPPADR